MLIVLEKAFKLGRRREIEDRERKQRRKADCHCAIVNSVSIVNEVVKLASEQFRRMFERP